MKLPLQIKCYAAPYTVQRGVDQTSIAMWTACMCLAMHQMQQNAHNRSKTSWHDQLLMSCLQTQGYQINSGEFIAQNRARYCLRCVDPVYTPKNAYANLKLTNSYSERLKGALETLNIRLAVGSIYQVCHLVTLFKAPGGRISHNQPTAAALQLLLLLSF